MSPHDRVAVVCAGHHGNSGMHSVDLAAVRFLRECGRDFTLFTAHPTSSSRATFDGVGVQVFSDPAVFQDYSHVLYWGDFLNNPIYGSGGFAKRHGRPGMSEDKGDGYAYWRRLFTLHEHPDLKARVFAIGGNFQHRFNGPRMARDLKVMAERFAGFYPRDPFSTRGLCRFIPFDALSRVHQGMDAAFLLRPPARRPEPGDHFCWSFGRSGLTNVEPLIEAVAEATGLRAHHLGQWLKLPAARADEAFAEDRHAIGSARFVLTDTYHLIVNSITMGTPVIPVARPDATQRGTVGDFKKQTLLEMLGLRDRLLLVPPEQPAPDCDVVIARARESVARGRDGAAQDYRLVAALTEKFRADLKRDVFGILPAARDDAAADRAAAAG